MTALFSPLALRSTTFRNRAWVAPMCQYSSVDGQPTDWHLVHLGSFARGGAGLVISEATAVTPEGRISPDDAGIWNDEQAAGYQRINDFLHSQGAAAGLQLAHAGRKASTYAPWKGRGSVAVGEGGWVAQAPSAEAYEGYAVPAAMSLDDIEQVIAAFVAGAVRADRAGFDVAEIHAAHGYLLHQFLSPLSNKRTDAYGGDFAGRVRLLLEVVEAVRAVWPDGKPLFVRVSATDWAEGGWDLAQTVEVSALLGKRGVDLVDVSTGGLDARQQIASGSGYQVPHARGVREGSGVPVAAVGLITDAAQAEQILTEGSADAILLARAWLRDPNWALHAAAALGHTFDWPVQWGRAGS